MKKIRKILILGGPGSGKTSLAKKISEKLEIPVVNLDRINYKQNWEQRKKEERDKIILEVMKEKEWIMEGIYKTTLEQRANEADFIIYLKCSTVALMYRVIKRFLLNVGKEKEELNSCKERLTWDFIKYTFTFNYKEDSIFKILNKVDGIEKKLIIINNGKFKLSKENED